MSEFIKLRKLLHSRPELSGEENNTSKTVISYLDKFKPDNVVTNIGGYGVAAEFRGEKQSPRILIRCELDALPIQETLNFEYQSKNTGISHKCGHDGHMAILTGLAEKLSNNKPNCGPVILFFQPSEETGEGAEKVLNDPKFKNINPDMVLALHNLPGYPRGSVIIKNDIFASASIGLVIKLHGNTSHAAEPEAGKSPVLAVAQIIEAFSALPQFYTALHQAAQITIIHVNVGKEAFGTSPGEGTVMATLRSHSQEVINDIVERSKSLAKKIASTYDLDFEINIRDPFPSTINDSSLNDIIEMAANELDMKVFKRDVPFAWLEDFGHFTSQFQGSLFGLGAGESHPALHNNNYDFPDEIIEPGMNLFYKIIQLIAGKSNV